MRNEPAQASISAANLGAAYSEDEAGATSKYNGKVLEVTGVINNTSRRSSRGKLGVTLHGHGQGLSLTCYFLESEANTVTRLAQGQTVTVKGRNDTSNWFLMILRDCVVVEVGAQQYVLGQGSREASTETKGCFIATAVYGNVEHPDVRLLRKFRDEVLLPSALGRFFVSSYYLISPVIIACIRTKMVKLVIKTLILQPVIAVVRNKLDTRNE